jgi:hypothetical protein
MSRDVLKNGLEGIGQRTNVLAYLQYSLSLPVAPKLCISHICLHRDSPVCGSLDHKGQKNIDLSPLSSHHGPIVLFPLPPVLLPRHLLPVPS